MSALTIIFTIVQLLSCVFLIAVVLLQSGKSDGLGAVAGSSAETFFGKGKSKSLDATLARMTKWVGIVFVVLTLVLSLVK